MPQRQLIAQTHPVADLFPMMSESETLDLGEDIMNRGLIHPIVLDANGDVLDGRNRLAACIACGVEPTFTTYDGDDPIGYAIAANVQRRHLNESQRAMVALSAEPLFAEQAAQRKGGRPRTNAKPEARGPQVKRSPQARDEAAKAVGTSGRSVARAKVVAEKAPDLAEQVVAGEMALVRAERIVRDRQAEQKRKQAASEDAKRRKEAPRLDLRLGDFRDVLDDVRNVDAIITDPPYGREWLPLLADLADWADDALTDDGILAVLMGQAHLPGVYQRLDGRRPYRWTMCYRTPGSGTQMHHARLMTNWKPVLLYGNGPRIHDVITAEGSSEATRAHHEWGQDLPAFRELVSRLCRPGQTVADPFTGAGTTLIAARDYGCNVIGAELDPDHHATALRRLS